MAVHLQIPSVPATRTRRPAGAFGHALLAVLLINLWLGARLPVLIQESSIDALLEIERRIAAVEAPERVKVLILGNSHAVAGLRPPTLAPALGLAAEEVFNMALPGTSPREMRLLAERHMPRFSNVRRSIIAVDEYFVGGDWEIEYRLRFLTRFAPAERWRYASEAARWDARPALLATMGLPAADFGPLLRAGLLQAPAAFAQRLLVDRPLKDSKQQALAQMAYPWGYPPTWENPALTDLPAHRQRFMQPAKQQEQASYFLKGEHLTGVGLANMEALARSLEARGSRVWLVEPPYAEPLRKAFATHEAARYGRYQRSLEAYLAGSGRALARPVGRWGVELYYDVDHLNATGARRMAAWLAPQLDGER